ncbi:helix-turn-helix domain-containing protein [Micromonospora sp. NPDC048935]|uniref:helix-turn-helix domain-containing protein n=1 Tax=Micromonospora sp. NPDC048935 TaxID=3364262 RepID=UPI003722F6B8
MDTDHLLLLATARRRANDGTGRAIRLTARLSLADVGSAIGVDRSTIWRWEEGRTKPRGEHALRWAALLNELERAQADVVTAA